MNRNFALASVPIGPPELLAASRNIPINVVDAQNVLRQERAYLCSTDNPSQCYQKWRSKATLPLNGRGEIVYCQVLLRDHSSSDVVFRKSDFTVAIKKLRRRVIDAAHTVNENPYNEIRIMQEYGNYENVLPCYEALQDENYLYIVMLFVREGDLFSHIQHGLGGGFLPREEIPSVMRKLVSNLKYLQLYNLIHRDLKTENCVWKEPWIPFIDFAMTVQAVVLEGETQNVVAQGPAGSQSYISPEIFRNENFNHKVDIWALGCILWNLLTGIRLYSIPDPIDDSFTFFIRMNGLVDENLCNVALEELLDHRAPPNDDLLPRLQAVQILSGIQRDLLQKLLQEDPAQRPTLDEILQHAFLQ